MTETKDSSLAFVHTPEASRIALDRFAYWYYKKHSHYPIVFGVRCYVHFGNRCQIIEGSDDGEISNSVVSVEGPFGEITRVELSQLTWAWSSEVSNRMREGQSEKVIFESTFQFDQLRSKIKELKKGWSNFDMDCQSELSDELQDLLSQALARPL